MKPVPHAIGLNNRRSWRSTTRVAAIVTIAGVLGGCMVGPDYKRPQTDVPETWSGEKSNAGANATQGQRDDARWWTTFGDPVLNSLVDRAISQNLTLRQAGLRVIQARAARGIAVGAFFPQTQLVTGQVSNNRVSKNSPQGSGDRSFSDYSVGLQAAWELDFWGRFRRGIESADASLDASVADYDSVLVLVAADVASTYITLRSLQEQLAFTQSNVKAQQDTLELTRVRFNAGAVSELDVATAQATLSNTQALIPQLEDGVRQAHLSLCVLLGRSPTDLSVELNGTATMPSPPSEIASGIPAELLRRRPDVRRAERTAAALSAQIGVAAADFYPSISISGQTGFQTSTFRTPGSSPGPGNLFDSESFQGFISLGVNWPILNYGRITNNVRVADARYQEAAVAYQSAVIQAASEVESGLSSFLRARERAAFLAESVTAGERTVELALIQYRQGATDFLRVNQAQVDLVERQNSLVVARASVAQGVIATYRALGGGWEVRGNKEFVPGSTIDEMRRRTDYGDILASDYDTGSDLYFFRRHSTKPADAGVPMPSRQETEHASPK